MVKFIRKASNKVVNEKRKKILNKMQKLIAKMEVKNRE
jgi:hypothetical protein